MSCEATGCRGAWREWGQERIEMAVPISPQELMLNLTWVEDTQP